MRFFSILIFVVDVVVVFIYFLFKVEALAADADPQK